MKTQLLAISILVLTLASGCQMFQGKKMSDVNDAMDAAADPMGTAQGAADGAVAAATAGQVASGGRAIAAEVMREHPMISDQPLVEYVNHVGQYVAMHLNASEKSVHCADGKPMMKPAKGIRVAVISSDDQDAFSVPGGFIFVPTGLIAKLRSEDQLAGVIAHETLHTMCGDDMPANMAQAATNPGTIVHDMMTKPYSQAQLAAADRAAIVALYRAGYYPNHYIIHVYQDEEVGKHSGGKARSPAMQKDVQKLASGIEKTVDARRSRYEKFQRGVLTAASKMSSGVN